jgi:voltage-gated potassium channel
MKRVIRVCRQIANSPGLLLVLFAATISTSSVLYMISEQTSFLNAIYWSLVTATTLGYGDFSPHLVFGKVLTSFLITFTVFVMLPTITANVAAWLIVNRDAFTDEEQEQIKDNLTEVLVLLKKEHHSEPD